MIILVTGSNGLLGQKIVKQLVKSKTEFVATSLGENRNSACPTANYQSLDITNSQEIQSIFELAKPTVVINTAAMTNVDACEADEVNCRIINVEGVDLLFQAAKKRNAHFIHLSTDFVFDGEAGPYIETDQRNPLSIYARSKVDSENLLINSEYKNWAILRTIIVFGEGENLSRSNIVLWAKSALKEGKTLTIVNDQFRAPTWADDLAWACIQTAVLNAQGIFHISGPETFSIYDLVIRIGKFYGLSTDMIQPISSATLSQKAKRPPKTGFIIDKAKASLGYNPIRIEESLALLNN
ncbi:MAG: SDR family oxidoreductase [Crocinitomix sp.]|nr:SDR family oxidoreductase [Crocinitomix sp.]